MESGTNQSATDLQFAGEDDASFRRRSGGSVVAEERNWRSALAVRGIFWRKFIDCCARALPGFLHRPLIWIAAFLFFFVAGPARKALLRNLRVVIPGSWRIANYFRVVRVFANFGWSLTDAAVYRFKKPRFRYELEGGRFLDQLGAARGAIVLTAHMGNYDLGAALFAERFHRRIRMVRAPEPDALAAQHLDLALQQSSAGAVQIGYSDDGTSLAFDLLNALRAGEIISIQGDRVVGEVARAPIEIFNREVSLPSGAFVLSFVSGAAIYPLFVVRTGYRKYKIVAREPVTCFRSDGTRDQIMAEAMQVWASVLEGILREYWPQWFAFAPLF
ncbi:MAG TPA: lysophospholipid acyltransferase family protein [Chthoniobacterales bacterium]